MIFLLSSNSYRICSDGLSSNQNIDNLGLPFFVCFLIIRLASIVKHFFSLFAPGFIEFSVLFVHSPLSLINSLLFVFIFKLVSKLIPCY